jgi:hypothetical protein
VAFDSIERRGASGWLVTWKIANTGREAFTVVEAWHPHGRFHSSRLRRSLRVPARGHASLEVPARVGATAGERVDNCFLILRLRYRRDRWRALARVTLVVADDGTPRLRIEAVDVHPAAR